MTPQNRGRAHPRAREPRYRTPEDWGWPPLPCRDEHEHDEGHDTSRVGVRVETLPNGCLVFRPQRWWG
jgi:hypothetical protein